MSKPILNDAITPSTTRPAALALLVSLGDRLEDSAPVTEVLKSVFERECTIQVGKMTQFNYCLSKLIGNDIIRLVQL